MVATFLNFLELPWIFEISLKILEIPGKKHIFKKVSLNVLEFTSHIMVKNFNRVLMWQKECFPLFDIFPQTLNPIFTCFTVCILVLLDPTTYFISLIFRISIFGLEVGYERMFYFIGCFHRFISFVFRISIYLGGR